MASIGLQDHFHPPLSTRRHWHAFHNAWATYLASDLNSALPQGYFAEPNVQFGIEIDVATFEGPGSSGNGSHAANWAPPAPAQTIPLSLAPDVVEVLVYDSREGPTLAGAIELVSPANKDRPAHRQAFVSKCESYLQTGAGLVIVDVVTGRGGSLHDELLKRLDASAIPIDSDIYVAAYHAVEREARPSLDVWQYRLELACDLPTIPLFLRGGVVLPVELGRSYGRTCSEQRIPVFA